MRSADEVPIRPVLSAYDPTRTWPVMVVFSCRVGQELHHRGSRLKALSTLGKPALSIFF